jgi:hypothetical protein
MAIALRSGGLVGCIVRIGERLGIGGGDARAFDRALKQLPPNYRPTRTPENSRRRTTTTDVVNVRNYEPEDQGVVLAILNNLEGNYLVGRPGPQESILFDEDQLFFYRRDLEKEMGGVAASLPIQAGVEYTTKELITKTLAHKNRHKFETNKIPCKLTPQY